MSTVIINHSDTRGGASVVSVRLLDALRALGEDAGMLVARKESAHEHVYQASSRLRARVPFYAEHLRIFAGNGFNREDLFKVSIGSDGLPLDRHPLVQSADTVILNWINQGMLSLEGIKRIADSGKRVLWTMHDMWNATGVCHHAGTCRRFTDAAGCRECPLLHGGAGLNDLSARTFARKKELYSHSNITFVAVSSWLERRCRESVLMRDADIRVIPNAFPAEDFRTAPTMTRAELGLPRGRIIIMGAARLDDPVKGLDLAVEVLNGVKNKDAVAVFFGAVRDASALSSLKMPYHLTGPVDMKVAAELYAHADVVLSASRYETLPTTLIEGMAAGAAPVAFDSGGQRDIITDGMGELVEAYDTEAMARAIDRVLSGKTDREALHRSTLRFSPERVARMYLEI